jgi:hypothetical protein
MSADSGALAGWFKRKATPPDEETADADAAANATLHGDDQEPVVVWEAANRMEAVVVAGRLQSEGIPAIIRGEALGDIYGLTYGSLAATAVLVPKLLADKALEILAAEVEWDTESGTENEAGDTTDDADRS